MAARAMIAVVFQFVHVHVCSNEEEHWSYPALEARCQRSFHISAADQSQALHNSPASLSLKEVD